MGRLRPEVQPLAILYTILAEKVPLLYTFIEKRYPFHIPTLGSVVLIFMKCLINKLKQPQGASIRKIIIKGPFKYLNDRFPYPFIYLKPEKGTSFGWSLTVQAIIGSTPTQGAGTGGTTERTLACKKRPTRPETGALLIAAAWSC